MAYKEKDNSISVIRLIAMSFIIICHMLQFYDNYLCEWFNIGVQIFLCISGYLYGRKDKPSSASTFIKNRFLRIYVEYIIVVVVSGILYFSFHSDYITPLLAVKMLIAFDTVKGGGHLWYVPTILLCSLLTLLYWDLFTGKKDNKRIITVFLSVFFVQIITFETFFSFFNSAWINCYFCGFILGCLIKNKSNKLYKMFSSLIVILAVITNLVQLYIDLILGTKLFNGVLLGVYHRFCNYAHLCLGISIFILFRYFLSGANIKKYISRHNYFLDLSDKFSYEIYLVHQFFILGPFSLMELTKMIAINIPVILILVVITALILYKVNNIIQSMLKKGDCV